MLNFPRQLPALRQGHRLLHGSCMRAAGHSKWQNIRHDKAKNDAKKLKEAFTMVTRIMASVKLGGVDSNAQLATLVEKARKANITKKIIDNAIKRGLGESTGSTVQTFEVMYEFMGPGGVAFIVEANTDNKTRTIGLVKHALSKFNAALSPCQYIFQRKGEIVFEARSGSELFDEIFEAAIDVGAEDVVEFEDVENEYDGEALYKITTDPADLNAVSNRLSEKGYKLRDSKTTFVADPDSEVDFPEGLEKSMAKCIDLLDDTAEVTNYYTNIRN
ncbi:DUF28-domain-containing protein [Metschnikowia bicuspidata var. bicuspidata NRRL YB-4993]|uniref:DUF28-domain-containing protein n=1 Tax=Metschnikowia bicuspidata var. bicuspidata NRRL YB-4993 TaxID=869754 RepID=A0A1A0HCY7_9ASCO|nr:DUF28-domain-containing protein [Metschnikowia bicuspidata var. bicuspidata NRRL YB-4993]OBA21959.1 DUF28-domain-containing protein [Metschnikowia bicuspidata var. bicuspidata NRRL YB-4993]